MIRRRSSGTLPMLLNPWNRAMRRAFESSQLSPLGLRVSFFRFVGRTRSLKDNHFKTRNLKPEKWDDTMTKYSFQEYADDLKNYMHACHTKSQVLMDIALQKNSEEEFMGQDIESPELCKKITDELYHILNVIT